MLRTHSLTELSGELGTSAHLHPICVTGVQV